jgi:MYXO-CTERM domain-containing protein
VKRPFAAAAVLVLTLGVAPPAARAPRPPAPLWDLFAADEQLGALSPALRAVTLDDAPAPLEARRAPASTPEPTPLALAALGLAGLAAGRRRSRSR